MIEQKAYPSNPDYTLRTQQTFKPGDKVRVGPAYQMGGTYQHDGHEGIYFVDSLMSDANYKVKRHPNDPDWDLIVYVARLTPEV